LIEVKKDAVRAESELAIREMLIQIAVCIRIVRETCGEDLTTWFADVGRQTFEEVDGLPIEDFNKFVATERSTV
jgi:hypothetical protein